MDKSDKTRNDKKEDKNIIICILATETVNSTNNIGVFIQYKITKIFFIIVLLYWVEKYKNNHNANQLDWYSRLVGEKNTIYYAGITYIPKINFETYLLALPLTEEEFVFLLALAFAFNHIVQESEVTEEITEPVESEI